MLGLIAWFARNRVAANLLMVIVMVAGAFAIPGLKQEVIPEIDSEMISVRVVYLGAAPEEVEEGVCMRVEEAVHEAAGRPVGLDHLDASGARVVPVPESVGSGRGPEATCSAELADQERGGVGDAPGADGHVIEEDAHDGGC